MSEVKLSDDQRKVALSLMNEGARIERQRILKAILANGSKTIAVSKLTKIIENG